jgi:hypothetical protein
MVFFERPTNIGIKKNSREKGESSADMQKGLQN